MIEQRSQSKSVSQFYVHARTLVTNQLLLDINLLIFLLLLTCFSLLFHLPLKNTFFFRFLSLKSFLSALFSAT